MFKKLSILLFLLISFTNQSFSRIVSYCSFDNIVVLGDEHINGCDQKNEKAKKELLQGLE